MAQPKSIISEHPALVLGLFETGLGVVRSLGRHGIKVSGMDFNRDIGFYSRYSKGIICPHPSHEPDAFLDFIKSWASAQKNKPVVFITSDDFLQVISANQDQLKEDILLNQVPSKLLCEIMDKHKQYLLARQAGCPVPATMIIRDETDAKNVVSELTFRCSSKHWMLRNGERK
jgi:D-aspartate ligase